MNQNSICSQINSLLIDTHRSLLQYANEAWPWAAEEDDSTQAKVKSLACQQEGLVTQFVEFLRERKQLVDFGVYPQEYTSLHFVALEYYLSRIEASQTALIGQLESAMGSVAGDQAAAQLVENSIKVNRQILNELKDLKITQSSTKTANA